MRLDNKAAILGESWKGHNVRPDSEGGEEGGDAGSPVPAREYRLKKIPLTKKQFETIVGEHAFESFFNQSGNKALEPAFVSFKTLWLDSIFKDCAATFELGGTNTKEINVETGAKVKNILLRFTKACNERACAEMDCTFVGIFPRNLSTLAMEDFLGKEIKVSLRLGTVEEQDADDDRQADLVKQARDAEEADRAGTDEVRAH